MRRDLETLVRLIREEVRIEGPDGGGVSDLFIEEAVNEAIKDLAEFFPVKDVMEIESEAGKNGYDLDEEDVKIENIIYVLYDGNILDSIPINKYMNLKNVDEGQVDTWSYWGGKLFLRGEVEQGKTIELWVTRAPKTLKNRKDEPEVPYYCDKAIKQYAVSACYREIRDYERANFHYSIYQNQFESIVNRGVPQETRGEGLAIDDSYFPALNGDYFVKRSDTNPGGNSQ